MIGRSQLYRLAACCNPPRPAAVAWGAVARLATVASSAQLDTPVSPEELAATQLLTTGRPVSAAYFTGNSKFYDLIYELRHRFESPEQYEALMQTVTAGEDEALMPLRRIFKTKEDLVLERGLIMSPSQQYSLINHLVALHKANPNDELLAEFLNQTAAAQARSAPRVPDGDGCARAKGSRKTSRAVVYLLPGDHGYFKVNGDDLATYFKRREAESATFPLQAARVFGKYHVWVTVTGGGPTGQAEAIAHGLAKALVIHEPHLRDDLGAAGLLKGDDRQVERKKPGQKKARKKFTWVKR